MAPMQGLTDYEFRRTFEEQIGGVEEYYTPFIRFEKGMLRSRDLQEIKHQKEEQRTVIQILPRDKDEAFQMAEILSGEGIRRIDINMGCPFVKVVKSGRGAALLSQPEKVSDILTVTQAFPNIQFSLKLRSGMMSAQEIMELVPIINNIPLHHVTFHPRTAAEGYETSPNEAIFGQFLSECKQKVIYNGDIKSMDDLENIENHFPAIGGVMIGRGLLERPDFLQKDLMKEERILLLKNFYEKLYDRYARKLSGDAQILAKMQAFWCYFLPEANRKLKKKIQKTHSLYSFECYASRIFEEY